ncbi:MAG: alpha/beta fold hydrolase [Myxococcota bacterium]
MIETSELVAPEPQPFRELAALREIARLPTYFTRLRGEPRGNVKVLVVPGFMTGDGSTWVLRQVLRSLGHRVFGWGLGRNRGDVEELLPRLSRRLEELSRDEPVHLIGWSLGGYLAREVARDAPDRVAQVITLASPVIGGPKYTVAANYYQERGIDLDSLAADIAEREDVPLKVPVTALYSPNDAVVCPAACIDPYNAVDHIPIDCAHAGFGFSPEVFAIVAARLAARPWKRDGS